MASCVTVTEAGARLAGRIKETNSESICDWFCREEAWQERNMFLQRYPYPGELKVKIRILRSSTKAAQKKKTTHSIWMMLQMMKN